MITVDTKQLRDMAEAFLQNTTIVGSGMPVQPQVIFAILERMEAAEAEVIRLLGMEVYHGA